MKKLILIITLMLLLYPSIGLSSEDELVFIDEKISVIEKRLEFIRGKEKNMRISQKSLIGQSIRF